MPTQQAAKPSVVQKSSGTNSPNVNGANNVNIVNGSTTPASKTDDAKKTEVPQLTGDEKAAVFEPQRNGLAAMNRIAELQQQAQAFQQQAQQFNQQAQAAMDAARKRIAALCPTCTIDPATLAVTEPAPPAKTAEQKKP